jgi:hypothetical protein
MSSLDDQIDALEMVETALEDAIINRAKKGVWRTREGKNLKIRNMSSQHLLNVYKYFTSGDGVEAPAAVAMPWIEGELVDRNLLLTSGDFDYPYPGYEEEWS